MPAPLEGVRVLEVANWVAAPSAGALLADLGASIVKVEPPRGDGMRDKLRKPRVEDGEPVIDYAFQLDNRGKRSVAVDLDQAEGQEVVRRLAGDVDVFTTNLLPARQRRYRLDAEALHALNPRVIHASVTAYGMTGPEADRTGYDMTAFFARGGVMSLVGEPDGPPPRFRAGQGDHTTALNLLAALLAALRLRERTGEGQVVEVSLMQTGAWTLGCDLSATLVDRLKPQRRSRRDVPNPLTKPYACADGRWVNLTMTDPKLYWPRLCRALGHPEWEADPRFDTARKRAEQIGVLNEWIEAEFAKAPLAEWEERLHAAGCTFARVAELQEVVADPQARAQDFYAPVEHPEVGRFETVNTPFKIAGADVRVRGPAPEVGAHTGEVLREAGLADSEIAELVARGIVGAASAESD